MDAAVSHAMYAGDTQQQTLADCRMETQRAQVILPLASQRNDALHVHLEDGACALVLLHHLLKLSKAQEKLLLQDIEHQSICICKAS
jgi:hypothetical protein